MAAQTFPDIPPHKSSPGQTTEFKTLDAEFGEGYTQSSAEGMNNIRESWDLNWDNEDAADIATIRTFINSLYGSVPFKWTPPGESDPKLWRVKNYKYKPNEYSGTLSMTFVQYFGPEPL